MNRRELLLRSATLATAAALPARSEGAASELARLLVRDADRLKPDDQGLLALPRGFSHVVLQQAGEQLHDGHIAPGQPDGMACFEQDGQWVLLRNHEVGDDAWLASITWDPLMLPGPADVPEALSTTAYGGVSRLVLDPLTLRQELAGTAPHRSASIVASNLVITGIDRPCSGGRCARGWVACEETDNLGHGWALLTKPTDASLITAADRRLPHWGRFVREGVAIADDETEVYQTEDRPNGLFYRVLSAGSVFDDGALQALHIPGWDHTDHHLSPTGPPWPVGTELQGEWIHIPDPMAAANTCREQGLTLGATAFNRCEGVVLGRSGRFVWFVASTAGPVSGGQLWRYDRTLSTLKLAMEVGSPGPHGRVIDRSMLSCPDNLALAPDGSLVMAEDNYDRSEQVTHQHLRLVTADGTVLNIARNLKNKVDLGPQVTAGAEFTGPCFSPDGTVLFVNLQTPEHLTIAITGPFNPLAQLDPRPSGAR